VKVVFPRRSRSSAVTSRSEERTVQKTRDQVLQGVGDNPQLPVIVTWTTSRCGPMH
jgi:hypothetical protein